MKSSDADIMLKSLFDLHKTLMYDFESVIKMKVVEILAPLFKSKRSLNCVFWYFQTDAPLKYYDRNFIVSDKFVEYTKKGIVIEENACDLEDEWFKTSSLDDLDVFFLDEKILDICYCLFKDKRMVVNRSGEVLIEDE